MKGGQKIVFKELSYKVVGLLFQVHNELGKYCREKQYGNRLQALLDESNLNYQREWEIKDTGNRVDFLIDNKIILELKTKQFFYKEDYYQIQRYLQAADIKLGLLVNFRKNRVNYKRIIKIERGANKP